MFRLQESSYWILSLQISILTLFFAHCRFCYFDNLFFNTSPREAYAMDCHQYHVMEVTQRALDDAGIPPERIPHNTAVYMSMRMGEMIITDCENRNIPNSHMLTGGAHTVAANRVSFFYDIRGASMGVEGACTASISSIHFGMWSLWNRECDAVIAGGVNVSWCPHFHLNQSHHGYLSSQGEARPFDSAADGRVRGEGAGVVILKPLDDALRDGDHVHCVIRGSLLKYHGNNGSITLHSVESFRLSMDTVYHRFGIPMSKVKYIESNATGNPDEDVMECKAIADVFGNDCQRKEPIKIGSVKANVGHTETASGVIGFIKAAMMLAHGELYPQANLTQLNEDLQAIKSDVQVQQKYEKTNNPSMVIGLNVTSFAGQQCHMVLEKFKNSEKMLKSTELAGWKFGWKGEKGKLVVLPLTAKTQNALRDVAKLWLEYKSEEDANVVAGWMGTRMAQYAYRMVILADGADDFQSKLKAFIEGGSDEHVIQGKVNGSVKKPKICFVFPGQGQQWWDMGRQLYANEPVYRDIIDQCDREWKKNSGYSFLEEDKTFVSDGIDDTDSKKMEETSASLIAIVSNQLALHRLMVHWGIEPDLAVGHSLGEASAIYAAGGMTLEECVAKLYVRATCQERIAGTGTMAAARMSVEEAEELVTHHDDVYVACMNSPVNVTLAGGKGIIKKLCEAYPTKLREIRVLSAFHTPHLEVLKEEFVERLEKIYVPRMANSRTSLYTSVFGDKYDGLYDPKFWWKNMGGRVNFTGACQSIFRDYGSDVLFVEIGASATLLGVVRQTAQNMKCTTQGLINCGIRSKNDLVSGLRAVASIYLMGCDVDWNTLTRKCAKYSQVPPYPFQGNYYRLESELFQKRRLGQLDNTYKGLLGEINVEAMSYLEDYSICDKRILPSASYIEYLAELSSDDKVHLINTRIHTSAVIPQRLPNGGYESVWMNHVVDGNNASIRKRDDKITHASCQFGKQIDEEDMLVLDIEALENSCHTKMESTQIYRMFEKSGLIYGKSFQLISQISIGDGEAVGYIVSQGSKVELLQVTTLDAIFQVALAAFTGGAAYTIECIQSVRMHIERMPYQEEIIVYTRLLNHQLQGFECDLSVSDDGGNVLLELEKCKFVIAAKEHNALQLKSCIYKKSEVNLETDEDILDRWVIVNCPDDTDFSEILESQLPNSRTVLHNEFNTIPFQKGLNVVYILNKGHSRKKPLYYNSIDQLQSIKDLLEKVKEKSFNMWIVLSGADDDMPVTSMLNGWIKSMANTSGSVDVHIITMNECVLEKKADSLLQALKRSRNHFECKAGRGIVSTAVRRLENLEPVSRIGEWTMDRHSKSFSQMHVEEILCDGEISIRIKAVGITSTDVYQCAGVVEKVGNNVRHTSVGDQVVAFRSHSISSVVVCQEHFLAKKPDMLGWTEASTFGFTAAIAYHSLKDMAKVEAGDNVYIVNAETPVGQACGKIGKALGASIICSGDPASLTNMFGVVTVVDPQAFLTRKQLIHHIGCKGLDVVICPNGETLPKVLVDSMKPNGRAGIISHSTAQDIIDPRVTTCLINGTSFINRCPKRFRECYELAASLMEGQQAYTPQHVTPIEDYIREMMPLNSFFSLLIPDDFKPTEMKFSNITFKKNATYLLTKSSCGLEMELGVWLVNNGVRHLAFVSKTDNNTVYQVYNQQQLEGKGCSFYHIIADVNDQGDVASIFETLNDRGAPEVKGVFHMDNECKSNEQLIDLQAFSTYNLHQQTISKDLDHFVVFSSVSGFLGNPRCPSLSASSALIDWIAEERKVKGLPGLSCHIGPFMELSHPQLNREVLEDSDETGTRSLLVKETIDLLNIVLQLPDKPAVVAIVDQVTHHHIMSASSYVYYFTISFHIYIFQMASHRLS